MTLYLRPLEADWRPPVVAHGESKIYTMTPRLPSEKPRLLTLGTTVSVYILRRMAENSFSPWFSTYCVTLGRSLKISVLQETIS